MNAVNSPIPNDPEKLQRVYSVAERISPDLLGESALQLVAREQTVPVIVSQDTSLRAKIIDSCGMACNFCHNEGTPVASAHEGHSLVPKQNYRGGRVSVFQDRNFVDFIPGLMSPDDDFFQALSAMRDIAGVTELHLTGGEPTLHKELPQIVAGARELGFDVKITSNGENAAANMQALAEAGLQKINFSIFGTTAEELASVQADKFNSITLAGLKLKLLQRSIEAALGEGIQADANIVMSDATHAERVLRIIEGYDKNVSVRILNDLDRGDLSYAAIYELLAQIGAQPTAVYMEAGSSNSRVKYALPGGREIYFKQIRRTTLPETCVTCPSNNDDDCKEGYYGLRLYVDKDGRYKVGVCIQRMDLTVGLDEFKKSTIPGEILDMRQEESQVLAEHYRDRIMQ